ncbi:hypothetical protein [Poseidonibacter lekithochrous]|uniref:hypothetical protein n=1 Tax=Poseidonibacter lekithochrous TaxID=1904463 RepID=UPI0008FC4CBF|nr:hypothetical protein [Poseidonibacter lekithochrous]QKJ22325.1 hypothetical protein ALEK_1045 [Poseidonibacter lekithochrous]
MSIQKELESLIKNDVLLEIEDYIDELFEIIAAKKEDERTKEELANIQEMRDDFIAMLKDIESGDMDDEEAEEILEEIKEMRAEEE